MISNVYVDIENHNIPLAGDYLNPPRKEHHRKPLASEPSDRPS